MTFITLDIETLPTTDKWTVERVIDKLQAPGNYKKPEAIEKWLDEHKHEAIRKTALSAKYGTVLCIGYAIEDKPPEVLTGSEKAILRAFRQIYDSTPNPCVIGHRVNDFDLTFLNQRMLVHGLVPFYGYDTKPWNRDVIDTSEVWACGSREYISLDDLCYVLGVETPKGDIDGSKVYDYWMEGRTDEIYDYCKRDVSATRECFDRMMPNRIGVLSDEALERIA